MRDHLKISETLLANDGYDNELDPSELGGGRVLGTGMADLQAPGKFKGRYLMMMINDAPDYGIDPDYKYRVSDLKQLLPADDWIFISLWGAVMAVPGKIYPAGQQANAAALRLNYCEHALKYHTPWCPRLKIACIKEREMIEECGNLKEFYRRKRKYLCPIIHIG